MKKKRSSKRAAPLGQHFLTGQWAAAKLVESLRVQPNEAILEIGPGKGALTKELLKTGVHVVAVEKDPCLVQTLHERFTKPLMEGRLVVVEQDIRDFNSRISKLDARSYVVAANIPYYITGEIIRMFLTTDIQPRAMALLVQKEVAERIVARDKKESILSISVKVYGKPKIIAKVSRGNFSPPPSVDSSIILIENVSRDFFSGVDEKVFFDVIRAGFSSKRKLLAGNLSQKFGFTKPEILDAFARCEIPETTRAENVALEQWKCLAQELRAASVEQQDEHE